MTHHFDVDETDFVLCSVNASVPLQLSSSLEAPMLSSGSPRHCIRRGDALAPALFFLAILTRSTFSRFRAFLLLPSNPLQAFGDCQAMAALSSCGVLNSLSDAATISFSSVPKTASMRSPQSVVFIRGASEPQRTIEAKQRAGTKLILSRRGVMLTSLSAVGIMLLPKCSRAVEVNDKDFREKLLEQIDSLQQLVNKSVGDVKEAVTTKAEEAMSSLKFGDDKAAEKLTETKSSIVEIVQEDKLAQN